MNDALELITESKSSNQTLEEKNFAILLQDLKHNLKQEQTSSSVFMRDELASGNIFTNEESSSLIRDVKVPTMHNTVAKDLLPFIPQYQVDLLEERKLLHSYFKRGSTIVVIGPSGLGKTALVSCNNFLLTFNRLQED